MSKEKTELEALKGAADYYGTVIMILTTRVSYYHEEFEGITNTVNFIKQLRAQVVAAIEKIEPPQVKKEEPLEMDLTHVTAEKSQVVAEFN